MEFFRIQGHIHSRRQSNSCLGWRCLNSATHFGIIFSIVIVFLVLSVVWMYCLGKARIFRKKTKTSHVSSRRRVRRRHRNPKITTTPVSYVAQQLPVFGYGIFQQPPLHFFLGPQVPATQPLGFMNAQVHLPTAMNRPQGTQLPGNPGVADHEHPKTQDSHPVSNSAPDNESPSHHTWWQRFYRAFNLPVGAASTIASSPSPEPLQSTNTNVNHAITNARFENRSLHFNNRTDKEGGLEPPAKDQSETSSMLCNVDASSDSVQSIRSDVATVHSDDFELT